MNRAAFQPRLDELRAAAQRISTNLVELEIDPSRQLLEATRLQGRSAERWATASASLNELWRCHGLLETAIERAGRIRAGRRGDELRWLLEGPSIELSSGSSPLAERQLLGTAGTAERCSPHQLLEWMGAIFEGVKGAIAELTAAWERLTPKLDTARRLLSEAQQLAEQVGEPLRQDLEVVADRVDALARRLATDPLSVAAPEAEELERQLRSLRDELEGTAGLKHAFEARVGAALARLERLERLVAAVQTSQRELVLKITLASPPRALQLDPQLRADLGTVLELGGHGRWGEARIALADWDERVEVELANARQELDSSRAAIQARNQFRALLDAYRVKAERLGRLEDPELQQSFAQAEDVLYNAPSDLALAAQLVRSFQCALTSPNPAPEVRT